MTLTFKLDNLEGDDIRALLESHFAHLRAISPPESCHVMNVDSLKQANLEIWSCYQRQALVACGGLMSLDGSLSGCGELKSMRAVQGQTGKGYGRAVLNRLIERARQKGMSRLYLETGGWDDFIPARRLYESAGFVPCPPFGDYKTDPNAVFMTLAL